MSSKSKVMKLAEKLNVVAKDVSTYGTWSMRFTPTGIINPGMVNVTRLAISGNKDLFWDACERTLIKHFN